MNWDSKAFEDQNYNFRLGSDIVNEIITGHSITDILRELAQNSYDAHARKLEITFDDDAVIISDNGDGFNEKGWKRVSVLLSTGNVGDGSDIIESKTNSLGSKNIGLRTLFLIGDSIHIRSKGRQTLLKLFNGVPDNQLDDPDTIKKNGVFIRTSFRQNNNRKLQAFSLEQEMSLLDKIFADLGSSLIKLGGANKEKGLKEVIVRSKRCQREMFLRLDTRELPSADKRLKILQRRAWLKQNNEKPELITELEYHHFIDLPESYANEEFINQNIPEYFYQGKKRIFVGVSIRIKRGKLDLTQVGHFFYPILVPEAFTNSCIDISAPFMLDAKRESIIPPTPDSWNLWLLKKAAESVVKVTMEHWFSSYGAGGYIAALHRDGSSSQFGTLLDESFKSAECWPTSKKARGKTGTPVYEMLSSLNLATSPDLESLLDPTELLDQRLAWNESLKHELNRLGILIFTLNSAVRLRCAGENQADLATKILKTERSYYYTDFPAHIEDQKLQETYFGIFTAHLKELNDNNLTDLKCTPTTLNANDELKPAQELMAVPEEIWNSCGIPMENRLNRKLCKYPVIKKLAKHYDLNKWIEEICSKSQKGNVSASEREALYETIKSHHGNFGRKLTSLIRRSPVLKNQKGEWTKPENIFETNIHNMIFFKPILDFPHDDYVHDKRLSKALRFKQRITDKEFAKAARYIEQAKDINAAREFLNILQKYASIIKKETFQQLKDTSYVLSSDKFIKPPAQLNIPNEINKLCLTTSVYYGDGATNSLLARLGCRRRPHYGNIVIRLNRDRNSGLRIIKSEIIYQELVSALIRDRQPSNKYENENILWNGQIFSKPNETLLGMDFKKRFGGLVPTIYSKSEKVRKAYIALGVRTQVERQHWRLLLENIINSYQQDYALLNLSSRNLILQAYANLASLPNSTDANRPYFLARSGHLYSLARIREKALLRDDDPELARKIEQSPCGVDFAYETPETKNFYDCGNIELLSRAVTPLTYDNFVEKEGPPNFDKEKELQRIQDNDRLSAILAIIKNSCKDAEIDESKLDEIKRWTNIKFVQIILRAYLVKQQKVWVSRNQAILDNSLVLQEVRSLRKAREEIAWAIASLVSDSYLIQGLFIDRIISLLSCDDTDDIEDYMSSRSIPWKRPVDTSADQEPISATTETTEPPEITPELGGTGGSPGNSSGDSGSGGGSGGDGGGGSNGNSNKPPKTLPLIGNVKPRQISRELNPLQGRDSTQGSGGWGRGRFGSGDPAWDKMVGRQGEEIVFLIEKDRVESQGKSPDKVIWVSDDNPQSNHDIKSIDENGNEIWIEVKSTTGTGGSFPWTSREFKFALEKRDKYYLYRVYEADTEEPSYEIIQDPTQLVLSGHMELDFDNMIAKIENIKIEP